MTSAVAAGRDSRLQRDEQPLLEPEFYASLERFSHGIDDRFSGKDVACGNPAVANSVTPPVVWTATRECYRGARRIDDRDLEAVAHGFSLLRKGLIERGLRIQPAAQVLNDHGLERGQRIRLPRHGAQIRYDE
jgi:hypothetical protein